VIKLFRDKKRYILCALLSIIIIVSMCTVQATENMEKNKKNSQITTNQDIDGNGINDEYEQTLAEMFCPCFILNSGDQGVSPEPVDIMIQNQLWKSGYRHDVNQYAGESALPTQGWDYSHIFWKEHRQTWCWFQPSCADHSFYYYPVWHFDYAGPNSNCNRYSGVSGGYYDQPSGWYQAYKYGKNGDPNYAGSRNENTVYAHLFLHNEEFVIQYWFFYPFNDFVNNHEGDWEHINVIITSQDPSEAEIDRVTYYFHHYYYIAYTTQKENPETFDCYIIDDTHPVVFVGGYAYSETDVFGLGTTTGEGHGSHGSYPICGTWPAVSPEEYWGFLPAIDETVNGQGLYIEYTDIVDDDLTDNDGVIIIKNPDQYDCSENPEMSWLVADILWGYPWVDSMGTNVDLLPLDITNIGNRATSAPTHHCGWWAIDQDVNPADGLGGLARYYNLPNGYSHVSDAQWTPTSKWTVMIYYAADNSISNQFLYDINEMEQAGVPNNVNIVTIYDGINHGDTALYKIQPDLITSDNVIVSKELNDDEYIIPQTSHEINTGDPSSLVNFVTWTTQQFPAEKYCLIIRGHSFGWNSAFCGHLRPFCEDYTNDFDYLTMSEFNSAMKNIQNHLENNEPKGASKIDIIGFDAAYMSMLEVIYQLLDNEGGPLVDYVIGSENHDNLNGYPYNTLLCQLYNDPSISSEDLAQNIVETYITQYSEDDDSLAAFNMQKTITILGPAVDDFAQLLTNNITDYYTEIYDAFPDGDFSCTKSFIDLFTFAERIIQNVNDGDPTSQAIRNSALNVLNAINQACYYEEHGPGNTDAHGVLVYIGDRGELGLYPSLYDKDKIGYEALNFREYTSWYDFLEAFHWHQWPSGPHCGDANHDLQINIGDAVCLVNYVFKGGYSPSPICRADVNGDGSVNVGDAVYLINYVFKGGPEPICSC